MKIIECTNYDDESCFNGGDATLVPYRYWPSLATYLDNFKDYYNQLIYLEVIYESDESSSSSD